ncbi:transcription regulator gal80 [Mucor velutinosus]|uniref:Transcription regulator gal80 n=1 Tax=Mucor velutinosus TaxID=708070 RepID=A0AAN7DDQ1_9FUNG|nr:transcription regulator gal80 [Mucor velutinosus]
MSVRKQSPYGPFVERVLLPALRIGLLLLILLAIGFGSWLETNESITDCSFKSSMSFHQVYLYRNITSNLTTPDSVSFGLWKTCYFYALNCSCTPTNLRYQPDVSTILQVATEHNATPPLTGSTSLSRVIPLMLATVIGGAAFFIGLWANRRGKYMYRKVVVALLSLCAILIAYVFGWTYDQYFKSILKTCKDRNNAIYCARHAVGTEVVIFAVALALLFIAFGFWFFASAFFTKKDDLYEQEEPFEFAFWKKRSSELPDYTPPKRRRPIPSEKPLQSSPQYQPQDELAVWRDVDMYGNNGLEDDGYWEHQDEKKYYDSKHNSKGYYYDSPVDQQQQQHSLSSMSPVEKVSLTPPPPVSSNHLNSSPRGHKSRVTSNEYSYQQSPRHHRKQRRSPGPEYHDNYNALSPQKYRQSTTRKESNDSALTFGNGKRQQRRRSSGRPLSEMDPQQQYYNSKSRNKTPTSMSPHPFQFPNSSDMMMGNSFCMTPFYNEDNGSSGSGSSNGGYFVQDGRISNQYQVPILGMPPTAVEHPLNKKVITDKRIQSYLQQQQHSTSSNST